MKCFELFELFVSNIWPVPLTPKCTGERPTGHFQQWSTVVFMQQSTVVFMQSGCQRLDVSETLNMVTWQK